MKIFTRFAFSSIKQQIQSLQGPYSNVPNSVLELVDRKLLKIPNHPLSIIKERIKTSLTDRYVVLLWQRRVKKIKIRLLILSAISMHSISLKIISPVLKAILTI